jgi:hypothetical protein
LVARARSPVGYVYFFELQRRQRTIREEGEKEHQGEDSFKGLIFTLARQKNIFKQHLRIKLFLGNSHNAVKTQIWCAISTYVLIAIVKKELQLKALLYTLLQILSVSVFEETEISCALHPVDYISETAPIANQLNLFDC